MKAPITLLLIFFSFLAHSQEKKLIWTKQTCENGIDRAQKDFDKGYYFCESFGLIVEADPEFTEFYHKYLLDKKKIISVNGGCVITDYNKCYTETMGKLVFEKFGDDIFERSLKEAKELYKK